MRPINMKKCSSSLVIKEIQIKTTLKYHLMPVRMVIVKNIWRQQMLERMEKQKHLYTVGGNVNQFDHCGRQSGDSSRIQKQKFHLTQQSHYWVYTERNINHSTIKTHEHVYSLQHYSQEERHEINLNALQCRLDK